MSTFHSRTLQKGAGFRGNRAVSTGPNAIPICCKNIWIGVNIWPHTDNGTSTDNGPISGKVVSSEVEVSQRENYVRVHDRRFGDEHIGLLLV